MRDSYRSSDSLAPGVYIYILETSEMYGIKQRLRREQGGGNMPHLHEN